jgi:TolA-binding protein
LLFGLLLLIAGVIFAQERPQYSQFFDYGTNLYHASRWMDAAAQFRSAQEIADNTGDWSEALYWLILAELAASDYGSALRDMDLLERRAPGSARSKDIVYHRARAYYNLGYFEDALVTFKRYNDNAKDDDYLRKAAAFFWMGECLYSMGQLEKAEEFYNWIITQYPGSPKYEMSSYRIDLIKQKKIEQELLTLLRWSHEESLRTNEDYQRRIRAYEQALDFYQKRVAELSSDTRVVDLENMNAEYQDKLASAEAEVRRLRELQRGMEEQRTVDEAMLKARQNRNDMEWLLRNLESDTGGSQ